MSKKAVVEKELPYDERSMFDYSKECIQIIGDYTAEQRAVPDFRDGLKPVQRRIVWAMINLNLTSKLTKSARISGEVTGLYHPHGTAAVYPTMVNMSRYTVSMLQVSGNWGSLIDEQAAERYTECKLSKNAIDVYMDKDYVNEQHMVPNYDGSRTEPVILNSKLPMLLLNGAFGIVFGGQCIIPAFEPEGVIKIVKMVLNGKKITGKTCLKHLVPICYEGGEAYYNPDDIKDEYTQGLLSFYETGRGDIWWMPRYEIDKKTNSVLFTGFPPSYTTTILKKLEKIAEDNVVSKIDDEHTINDDERPILRWRVYIKRNLQRRDFDAAVEQVVEYFEGNQRLNFIISERKYNVETNEWQIAIHPRLSVIEFFHKWVDWRIDLEKRVYTSRLERTKIELAKQQLHLLMVQNRDVIIKALDSDNPEKVLVNKLKITDEQADYIMRQQIRTLKRLEEKGIKLRIKESEDFIEQCKEHIKEPVKGICDELNAIDIDLKTMFIED